MPRAWNSGTGGLTIGGEKHHVRDAMDAAEALDEALSGGGSVNVYMMHGGTNFGFLNGANHDGTYRPTVTSYDYDAPINEHGCVTAEFHAFRDIFAKQGAIVSDIPPTEEPHGYGNVPMAEMSDLFASLAGISQPIQSLETLTMEKAGQNYGYILYRTRVSGSRSELKIFLQEVRDRAWIFQDGKCKGVVDRNDKQEGLPLTIPEEGSRLDIFVENLGRVNYGSELHDRKGITHGVRLDTQYLNAWEIYPLDFTNLPNLDWRALSPTQRPSFYRGNFTIATVHDTFLKVEGRHGAAWINGFCLGRYWNIGPQKTLYIPGPLLREGENEIVIFEIEQGDIPSIILQKDSELGIS